MWNFILLELRKNRLLPLGLIGFSSFGLLLVTVNSWFEHERLMPILQVMCPVLLTLMSPVAALLAGASAGGGLRGAAAVADAPLPISPGRKVMASLLAALLGWLLVVAFELLLVAGTSSTLFVRTDALDLQNEKLMLVFIAIFTFICLALLGYGFAVSYGVRNGMIGGMAALGLAGATGAAVIAQAYLAAAVPYRAALVSRLSLITLIAFCGVLAALWLLAPWGERSIRMRAWRFVTILLALGAGSLGGVALTRHDLQSIFRHLEIIEDDGDLGNPLSESSGPATNKRSAGGALFSSRKGDIVWLTPEGKRNLIIPGEQPGVNRMFNLDRPFESPLLAWSWDRDGTLWIVRKSVNPAGKVETELWQGSPDAAMTLHASFPSSDISVHNIGMRDNQLTLFGWSGEQRESLVAPVPRAGKMPQWANDGAVDPEKASIVRWQPFFARGDLGRLTAEGQTLEFRSGDRTVSCALPGEALSFDKRFFNPRFPSQAGSEKIYTPQVKTADGSATAACHPDGRVELVWPGKRSKRYISDARWPGGVWLAERPLTLFLLTADGRFMPPVSLEKFWPDAPASLKDSKLPGVQALRIEGSVVWLALGGHTLVKLDAATGQPLQQWPLPPIGPLDWNETFHRQDKVTGSGFFHPTRERIYFVSWDGALRDLGLAMAD